LFYECVRFTWPKPAYPSYSNARIVRVIDFERALSRLTEEHQAILLLTYREHQPQDRVSTLTG